MSATKKTKAREVDENGLGTHPNHDLPTQPAIDAARQGIEIAAERQGFSLHTADVGELARFALIHANPNFVSFQPRVAAIREDAERRVSQYRQSAASAWIDKDRQLGRIVSALGTFVDDVELRKTLAAAFGVVLPSTLDGPA